MSEPPRPPELRFLKLLVAALAGVMILGILAIVALLALRLPQPPAPLTLPDGIELPDGARPETVSFGRDWVLIVTDTGEILIHDRATGALRQSLRIDPAP